MEEERWELLRRKIKETMKEVEKEEKGEKRRSWWDEECKEGKRRIRRELRKWRREEGGGEKYRIERLKYKGCEGKKREEVERWEREIKEVRTEAQAWKIVNRERKRRKRINEGIEVEEWDGYFKGLLGGGGMEGKKGKNENMG